MNEINIDGNAIKDPVLMAEQFNSYFTGLAKSLATKIPSPKTFQEYLPPASIDSFALIPISPEELISINKTLQSTHSCGPDDLNPYLLSPVMDLLAKLLAEV